MIAPFKQFPSAAPDEIEEFVGLTPDGTSVRAKRLTQSAVLRLGVATATAEGGWRLMLWPLGCCAWVRWDADDAELIASYERGLVIQVLHEMRCDLGASMAEGLRRSRPAGGVQ